MHTACKGQVAQQHHDHQQNRCYESARPYLICAYEKQKGDSSLVIIVERPSDHSIHANHEC